MEDPWFQVLEHRDHPSSRVRYRLKRPASDLMKHPSFYILSVLTLAVFGCSQQSKEENGQAGQSLTHAAKETGKAVTTDVKSGANAVKNATSAAKTTIKEKQAEHDKESTSKDSKEKGSTH